MPIDIDRPEAVRAGAGFDAEALRGWLRSALDLREPVEVHQFARGYSNLTYLVRVGERELVLRRGPPGVHIASAHDMGREVRILTGLARVWDRSPRPLGYCEDPEVIGTPFYVMERMRGVVLRARGASRSLDAATIRRVGQACVDTLAGIHDLDLEAAGLADLGRPTGYIQRQVAGWTRRYERAKTDDIPGATRVAAWLAEHTPPEDGAALIHNDFKFDNVLLDADDLGVVRSVFDWEMATVGDRWADLGTALSYWVQADDAEELTVLRFGPTDLPGSLTRAEVVDRYEQASGRTAPDMVFFYVLGLFKLAGVAQQLYARYRAGLTTERRYAAMIDGVRACVSQAERVIEAGRL